MQNRGETVARRSHKNRNQAAQWLAKSGIVVWLLGLTLILALATPRFLSVSNLLTILTQSSIIGIMAVGMTFVIISGGIDLSVGSIAGFSSITMGMLVVSTTLYRDPAALLTLGRDPLVLARAIAGALAVAGICGLVNGLLIAYAGLPPFIATLGMLSVARGVAAYVSAGYPAYGLPDPIKFLGQGKLGGIPMPVLIMVLVAVAGHLLLNYTTFGASVFALGGNREATRLSGIPVQRLQVSIYVLSGLLAGLGGIVLSGRSNLAHPDAALGFELFVVGAVVMGGTSLMGGKGGVIGSVLGAVLMAEVQNGINLLDIPVNLMQPILGAVIVLAVLWDQYQKSRPVGG
jgi:ribose transport system permease protein